MHAGAAEGTCRLCNDIVHDLCLLAVRLEERQRAQLEFKSTQLLLQFAAACQGVHLVHPPASCIELCRQQTLRRTFAFNGILEVWHGIQELSH